MSTPISLPHALWRGKYAIAAAITQTYGIPIDYALLAHLRQVSPRIRRKLIDDIDRDYGVFEDGHFRTVKFAAYLHREGIHNWPRLKSGALKLDDDTFKEMAVAHPQLAALRQLRQALVQLREIKVTVGNDARNRVASFPFASVTGRSQPSTSKNIFGVASWLRPLILPPPGWAVAYLDWCQQELQTVAKLSGDQAMMAACRSGDFYLAFAIQAGAAPVGATKVSHGEIRERFKQCALGVLYGMGETGLASRLGISVIEARQLLDAHRRSFPDFWRWSDATVDRALLIGSLETVFGWTLHVGKEPNVRRLRNYLAQANAAEMMRLAHIKLLGQGIRVIATVHDAFLIEAPISEIDAAVKTAQDVMTESSEIILDGFAIPSEAKIACYPERFHDGKGIDMWNRIMKLVDRPDAVIRTGENQ